MNSNSEGVTLFIALIVGVYFLLVGIKAKKVEKKKQAGILSIFMAICAFIYLFLGISVHALKASSWITIVSKIKLILVGVWLGTYLIMIILGHFKLLKKTHGKTGEHPDHEHNFLP